MKFHCFDEYLKKNFSPSETRSDGHLMKVADGAYSVIGWLGRYYVIYDAASRDMNQELKGFINNVSLFFRSSLKPLLEKIEGSSPNFYAICQTFTLFQDALIQFDDFLKISENPSEREVKAYLQDFMNLSLPMRHEVARLNREYKIHEHRTRLYSIIDEEIGAFYLESFRISVEERAKDGEIVDFVENAFNCSRFLNKILDRELFKNLESGEIIKRLKKPDILAKINEIKNSDAAFQSFIEAIIFLDVSDLSIYSDRERNDSQVLKEFFLPVWELLVSDLSDEKLFRLLLAIGKVSFHIDGSTLKESLISFGGLYLRDPEIKLSNIAYEFHPQRHENYFHSAWLRSAIFKAHLPELASAIYLASYEDKKSALPIFKLSAGGFVCQYLINEDAYLQEEGAEQFFKNLLNQILDSGVDSLNRYNMSQIYLDDIRIKFDLIRLRA